MDSLRHTIRSLTIITATLLVSCFDGREEVWIESDGSGCAEVTYSVPAAVAKLKGGEDGVRDFIENFLKDQPALKSPECEVWTEKEMLHVRVRASFQSALKLKELSKESADRKMPAAATYLAGKVNAQVRGLNIEFARTISPGLAMPGHSFMPASQFKDHKLIYIFHLPTVATKSNATRIENTGRTLVWEIPLAEAMKHPVTTSFKAPLPIPAWAVVLTVAFALIIIFLIGRFVRKRHLSKTAKHEKSSAISDAAF
ncbi:MAG: hypothetical protein HC845_04285 [Akkermansiaceae bacterium]|nr:hypothetical protein [Akkermansiaceae bacterium]